MKKFVVSVNGNSYEVEVEEVQENREILNSSKRRLEKPSLNTKKQVKPKVVKSEPREVEEKKIEISQGQEIIEAPMPGNIWKIMVEEGQEVKEGQVLLILEAMKMENDILAPRDGVVSILNTKEGSAVSTGEKLVVLD